MCPLKLVTTIYYTHLALKLIILTTASTSYAVKGIHTIIMIDPRSKQSGYVIIVGPNERRYNLDPKGDLIANQKNFHYH